MTLNYRDPDYKPKMLEMLKQLAVSKGGKCLSEEYLFRETQMGCHS